MLFILIEPFTGDIKYGKAPPVNVLMALTGRFLSRLGENTFFSFFIGAKPGTYIIHLSNFIIL